PSQTSRSTLKSSRGKEVFGTSKNELPSENRESLADSSATKIERDQDAEGSKQFRQER
ncbi:MAG: hypothetical protein ACI957_005049, partial [Verrucomicrobiales bacterium]